MDQSSGTILEIYGDMMMMILFNKQFYNLS
jgi:hypothetical protein